MRNIILAATFSALCLVAHKRDAASGEHGDLLDLIALNRGLDLRGALSEARAFLALPKPEPSPTQQRSEASAPGSPQAARRLFAASKPIWGTLAHAYLRRRGISNLRGCEALRFHPRCFFRAHPDAPLSTSPALIAAVTDLTGAITGVHRTWLDASTVDKASVATPRRAMGRLLGHGVRFGFPRRRPIEIMVAGEGVETMLSLRMVAPALPTMAALSAAHLAAIRFPRSLRRLYIARDNDSAGANALATLTIRARAAGIEAVALEPALDDFNRDLTDLGTDRLRTALRSQFAREDRSFLEA